GADGREEIAMNRDRLQATLNSFGVNAKISDITRGPTVTRYDLELEAGVKLTKLTNLAGDLALSLGVSNVRIAPIPDKISTVGVEVPNKIVSTVYLRDIIGSDNFKNAPSRLTFAIGKDIGGESICGNIAKLPHMLIAGTTGSGKSVCMNSLILSLLYKATPEEVRLIMIDPKMVELGIYNGIPHLYIPVVTDPKKAAGALQWSVVEMLKRYRLFSEAGVRDLKAYNERQKKLGEPILPQVVIVIDELADLMLVAYKEVEESICRVAQMGRASGMHLVIATQRPSADVITGLMKANIPSRIAFAVSSAMESRIILDQQGAEKLVGSGDMLYAPIGAGKPIRIQGAFVSDEEREEIVNFVKSNSTADYSDEILAQIEKAAEEKSGASSANEAESVGGDAGGDYDELLPQAVEVIFETKQASVSMLQRRLKLGYSRAARIVDQLEEVGVVGPFEGSKPRQIIMTHEQWQQHPLNGGSGESVPEQINFSEYENEDTIGEDE
ncbi:MAG: DNA translocase FtsK, partial [Oscillospiraceae bacterium]|nr:DNA translocase FtsK [Oscillospiraceae bacterium]